MPGIANKAIIKLVTLEDLCRSYFSTTTDILPAKEAVAVRLSRKTSIEVMQARPFPDEATAAEASSTSSVASRTCR